MKKITLAISLLGLASLSLKATTFNLETATISDIQAAMEAGALTSEKLTSLYLARIEAYDKAGPNINSFIYLSSNAIEEARALDRERAESGPRGPLHGIPVVFKDLIDVAEMPTTAGFVPFGAPVPKYDASLVAKLRAEGMVMLGKVSTSNWFGQGFSETHPIGATRNPFNLEHSPGGSSNGSGAAASAIFAPVAIGTDTSVSVQSPAASSGVVGIVGTYGMISRSGIVPRGATQDRPGPISQFVMDAVTTFIAMSGWCPEDLTTFEGMGSFPDFSWLPYVQNASLEGMRIGIPIEMFPEADEFEEVLSIFYAQVDAMREVGAYVVPIRFGNPSISLETAQARLRTAEYEKNPYTDVYFARLGDRAVFRTVNEMVETVGRDKFSAGMLRSLELPLPHLSPDYIARYRTRKMYINLVSDTMDKFDLDVLIQPFSMRPPPRLTGGGGGGWAAWSNYPNHGPNNLSSSLGLPAVVVPMGHTSEGNLPLSMQFVGRPYTELKVFKAAKGFEDISQVRTTPSSVPALPGETIDY
jgi:amidase